MADNRPNKKSSDDSPVVPDDHDNAVARPVVSQKPKEVGGRPGPDPTRYGDWEKAGRCIDF
jgi:hypothetical protein